MPCYEPREGYEDAMLKVNLDQRTQQLCLACQLLEDNNIYMPKALQRWWDAHKAWDKGRSK